MFRKRRVRTVRPEIRESFAAFRRTVDLVEEAKRRLAAAAPWGRSVGIPLAEALSAFEEGLREAASTMAGWQLAGLEDIWSTCSTGLDESLQRAERLRLGEAPVGYEQLYGGLAELMDPLDAFAGGLRRFRALGL